MGLDDSADPAVMLKTDARSTHAQLAAALRNPLLLRAGAALNANQIADAEDLLKRHLLQAPFDVAAIRMLAEVAARLGRYEDAEKLLHRALELAPDFDAARLNYAAVLQRRGKFVEARAEVARLLGSDPANPGALAIMAGACARTGDFDEAIAAYQSVLNRFPNQPKLWVSLGHVLKTVGRQVDSIAAYRRAIGHMSTLGEAWWSLANLKTVSLSGEDVAAMEKALREATAWDDRYHLHFALGKALEDKGDCVLSFSHYVEGNRLRRSELPYDPDQATRHMQRSRALLTQAIFEERRGRGCAARDPIFILGLPRAGSTLIEQILSSHSLVEGTMELPDIIALSSELNDRSALADREPDTPENYLPQLLALGATGLEALGRSYLQRTRVQRKTSRPFFIDKMPNNFAHVGMIELILPNAKIIDARRHPMASCFSCFKQHFSRGQGFTYSLDELGRYYRDYVALMDHYDSVLPGRVHRLYYEKLIANPEAEIRALLAYCGLDFEPSCLEFHRTSRPVRTASSEQVRRPINREAVDHWRQFEAWLDPLKRALGDAIERYDAEIS